MVYRILRCDSADQAWFSQLLTYLIAPRVPPIRHTSTIVFMNVMFSEFWPGTPTRADLETKQKSLIAMAGWDPNAASIAPVWPKYAADEYFGKWPSSPAPTLVLQGTLDPNTPWGTIVKPHYSGANQYFVEVPLANHGVAYASPMKDPTAPTCGFQIVQSFLTDPSKAPDASCIAGMAPLDYGNPPPEFLARVGIKDLFENP
jgi:hypothetical protein